MNIPNTILRQLGGNGFLALTGTKKPSSFNDGKSLWMQLSRNKSCANRMVITLTSMDDYTIEIYHEKMPSMKQYCNGITDMIITKKKVIEGVYCDQLQDIFEELTGLYVTFNRR